MYNITITCFLRALYLINSPSSMISMHEAVMISPSEARTDNDCLRLLIIDGGMFNQV